MSVLNQCTFNTILSINTVYHWQHINQMAHKPLWKIPLWHDFIDNCVISLHHKLGPLSVTCSFKTIWWISWWTNALARFNCLRFIEIWDVITTQPFPPIHKHHYVWSTHASALSHNLVSERMHAIWFLLQTKQETVLKLGRELTPDEATPTHLQSLAWRLLNP
jgi:hypothetical protein